MTDSGHICDLCGGNEFKTIGERDRHGKPLTTGLCLHCGMVAHLPLPTEAEIAEYYARDYRQDYHGERVPNPRRVMRAWNNGERIVAQLAPHLTEGSSIFEIGAGIGCTVKAFETHGYPASGIEPNKDFNAYTHEKIHANVDNVNLYDLPVRPVADTIILIHVIEHFISPTRALSRIHELLPDNGLFYVECPNIAAPFATFGRLFHFAHTYNFTPDTLVALAQKCGFELVKNFNADDHPDIQMLFRKSTPSAPNFAEDAATRVEHAIHRFNGITYHLRPSYLTRRVAKLLSYAKEAICAGNFVKRLHARLSATGQ